MKVLIIHGSPHKGNTLKLINKFKDAMIQYGEVDFEYININDLNLRQCCGCFNCITKGESLCPFKDDDINKIIEKLDKTDGAIFAAPTYMYSIPAVMKNLIDRLSYIGHRPRYMDKYAVVISTTCEVGLYEALKYLSQGTAWAWGFQLIGKLGAKTHPFYLDNKSNIKTDKQIQKLSKEFYSSLYNKKVIYVNFEEMMRFRAMLNHSIYSKEIFPKDYEYYKKCDEDNNGYFIKNYKINIIANLASKILAKYVGNLMKNCRNKVDMNQIFLD